jgi:hypothetical protein
MKVYAVIHYYDNGETYEDYREYRDTALYSTLDKATSVYWENVCDDYNGMFRIYEWELDTQEVTMLEESVYLHKYPEPERPDCDYYDDCEELNPEDWPGNDEYMIDEWNSTITEEDEPLDIEEWLCSEGYNYKIFKEIEEDRLRKLNAELDNLLTK